MNEMLKGATTDFFNNLLDGLSSGAKQVLKDAAGKIINANETNRDLSKKNSQLLEMAKKNKNLIMYGGLAAAGVITILILRK